MSEFDLSTLLRCSYGGSNFQVETMSVDSTPVVKEGMGRTGTKIKMTVDGYVSGGSAADLSAALTAVYADLAVDGRDFLVYGIGGNPIAVLYAAQCADGGPHIEWHSEPDTTPISQAFKLTVTAEIRGIGNPPKPAEIWKLTTRIRPDTLQEITRTGEVSGPDAPGYFVNIVLPAFEAAFNNPNWVTEFEYDSSGDANRTKAGYKCSARQTATALPIAGLAEAVDGDSSVRIDRDEQQRLVTTYDYDLVIFGSPSAMLTFLRGAVLQQAKGVGIWKEASNTTFIRERRLRASFVTLQAAGATPLMNFEQSLEIQRADATYDVKMYAGADPVVVQRPKTVERLIQTGSATCAKAYLQAPTAKFLTYLEPPETRYEDLGDGVQHRTTWKYEMYTSGGGGGGGSGVVSVLSGGSGGSGASGVNTTGATGAMAPSDQAYNVNGGGLKFLARSQAGGFIDAKWDA
jgi:hypothetical protein